ncbi:MAG: M20/M25/M40 family metallo-hydrolase [Acetobacteraceae bacterium]
MKAGLVVNAFVLVAYHTLGGHPGPLVGLITSDEEIASPFSRPIIEKEARHARVVLNSEPGRASGNVVSGRKGGVFMRFEVFGRAAHSGANFADGRSAIEEMAHKIIALHAMTDLARGTTVNVGLVEGGQTVNTVAPHAVGQIDLRYKKVADRQAALDAIGAIMDRCTVPIRARPGRSRASSCRWRCRRSRNCCRICIWRGAASLGMHISGEFTGGCADSGFAAAQGTPTLCGLGAVGGHAHTPDEYMEVATLVPRAQALAMVIARLGASALDLRPRHAGDHPRRHPRGAGGDGGAARTHRHQRLHPREERLLYRPVRRRRGAWPWAPTCRSSATSPPPCWRSFRPRRCSPATSIGSMIATARTAPCRTATTRCFSRRCFMTASSAPS